MRVTRLTCPAFDNEDEPESIVAAMERAGVVSMDMKLGLKLLMGLNYWLDWPIGNLFIV